MRCDLIREQPLRHPLSSMIRCYRELGQLETFENRFDYLHLRGEVGKVTFGFDRWINQEFYASQAWKTIRHYVIVRDEGCDLGIPGRAIHTDLLVHHMNPVTPEDMENGEEWLLEAEFLITTCRLTHNAIHYGDRSTLPQPLIPRTRGDTHLW